MGKPGAFLDIDRAASKLRPISQRVRDFDPLYEELDQDARRAQASRCMKCGVPFCQVGASFGKARPSGCPLHNLIPEWNELIYRGKWDHAAARLALTSPLPEFTSRVCPALCEAACNLGTVNGEPTTIHDNERAISDWEWANGGPARFEPAQKGAPRVAVVGSGPAGLACAWELARRGAQVAVIERDDRAGGLLMYGIPNMKLEKSAVTRRTDPVEELVLSSPGTDAADRGSQAAVGRIRRSGYRRRLARRSRHHRPGRAWPGRGLRRGLPHGRHALATRGRRAPDQRGRAGRCGDWRRRHGQRLRRHRSAPGRALSHPARVLPKPPALKSKPWPGGPNVLKTDYGQQEAIDLMGGEMRSWAVDTLEIARDESGAATGAVVVDLDWSTGKPQRLEDTERTLPAQLVLIACGFTGPEASVFDAFGASISAQGRPLPVMEDDSHRCAVEARNATGAAAIFACGDARTGSSLVVNAIADAMACADEVTRELARR